MNDYTQKWLAAVLLLSILALTDCGDSFKVQLSLEIDAQNPVDRTPPVPGENGLISTTDEDRNSITISWNQAADMESAGTPLKYQVFRSNSEDIATVEQIQTNGTPLNEWTENLTGYRAETLTCCNIPYYFNVLVKDGAGNISAYAGMSGTTRPIIYMFSTVSGSYDGDLGGRVGADAECSASYTVKTGLPEMDHIHAFLGVNENDEIRDMPANYGVPTGYQIRGPGGDVISTNWAALLDGSIDTSLKVASVVNDVYWTGSEPDGRLMEIRPPVSDPTCKGWTSNVGMYNEDFTVFFYTTAVGQKDSTSGTWLRSDGTFKTCDIGESSIICIGW